MASKPLDKGTISTILDKAGPALMEKLCINPMFMLYLVQAGVLRHNESKNIQGKEDASKQCNELLSHLYSASVEQFRSFCVVLRDKANRQDIIVEDMGLDVKDLNPLEVTPKEDKKTKTDSSQEETTTPRQMDTNDCEYYGIEIDIELRVRRMRGDHPAYEKFKRTIQDTLRHNRTGEGLDGIEEDLVLLARALVNKGRKSINVNSGSIVFRMYCPTLDSLQDLHTLCTSGHLAHLAEKIFMNHPAFTEFGLNEVEVEVTIDEKEFVRCEEQLRKQGILRFIRQDSPADAPHSADESETVILSVVGRYNRDPDGILLLDNLLTEQIKQLIPDATILHVVLEDQQKILADGQEASFVGYNKANAPDSTPSSDWLNYHTKDLYTHLIKHRVSHIIAYAPEFVVGAINIKVDFFPDAAMIIMINEQIDMQWDLGCKKQPGDDLLKWNLYAEALVTLGRQTYDDVEGMLSAIGHPSFDRNRLTYYLPSPPLHISQQEPCSKPLYTFHPVILILGDSIEAQEQQKMILPMVVNAINSVAEDLSKSGIVGQVAVKISGIPENEQTQLKDDLRPLANKYTSLECVEASSFSQLEEEMTGCHMCILPFGCATHSYGLEFMTSAGFGVPTLVPDSVGFTYDAQEIFAADDQWYLKEMLVQVIAAKSQQEEEEAWMYKIRDTLLNMQQVATNANAFREVIHNSRAMQKSQQDFISLLQAPPRKGKQWSPLTADSWFPYREIDYENLTYVEQATAISRPMNFPERTRLQYEYFHSQTPDLDLELITPNNKKTRFLKLWPFLIRCIQPLQVVDVMLAQGSINYVFHKEVHDRVKTHNRYAAIRGLLNVVRRRGEVGIDQLGRALQHPTIDCGFLVDWFQGIS